ncbi:MAG: ABC transporter ATP-binding protein [Spirochaetes bacterium]|nr:ABC transporter ATP-binding protein [Spirochaetota bacterium]
MNTQDAGPLLEIRRLTTRFQTQNGALNAADDVSLMVGKAETVGVVGESGCGKSVTSLSVLRLVPSPGKIEAGSILFDGEDLLSKTSRQMEGIRGKDISMIFQEPMTSLNPVYTVGKQVAEALLVHNPALGRKRARDQAIEMFGHVGISEPKSRFDTYPHQLSGGLRQRAMIAMALICRPKLLIADEPTTALDVTIEAQILRLMKKLQNETGTSILLISHNLSVIAETCDRVYVMYSGRIVEESDVFDLFDRTLHPYTSGLLASIPRKNSAIEPGKPLHSIPGGVPDMTRLPCGCKFAPRCEEVMEICCREEPTLADAGGGHCVRCWKFLGRKAVKV